jgi:hypothetical protein
MAFHAREYERLVAELREAPSRSPLPERLPDEVEQALHAFLVGVRMGGG